MESTYSYSDASDKELVRLGQAGNTAATGELFARHYKPALRLARGILKGESDVPMAQIAAALGLTLDAAKSRVFRARNAVHLSIEQMWSREDGCG